jgi:hypothetical protein
LDSKKILGFVYNLLVNNINLRTPKSVLWISLEVLLIAFIVSSCNNEMPSNPIANKPPTTKLFLPDSSISQQPSRIKLHWTGDDPDGIIIGFYFSFDGVNWTFTTQNDSLFELKIGAVDTVFNFRISAIDNDGNGKYDSQISQNNINFGLEPFTDINNNSKWDDGEPYTDIGTIDPNPATLLLPVKNSAPVISWNVLSTLPDNSFPAMSFGWNVSDIDGSETITNIKIALNDTANFILLDGGIRNITIRTKDFANENPLLDILIDGDPNSIAPVKLPGLTYNANNKIYIQAVDLSSAKSEWISLPDSSRNWYVKKPKGNLLIVDDYTVFPDVASFYTSMMDSIGLSNKYDILDLQESNLPYLNITFLETLKLFEGVLWYTDTNPSLNLANFAVQNYNDAGGKLLLSMQFPQTIDLQLIEGFLPIESDSSYFRSTIGANVTIASLDVLNYPNLLTNGSFSRVRAFNLKNVGVTPLYYFPNGELNGYIGFEKSSKDLFFIGAPLQRINGISGSIKNLLIQVLFHDFNLTL